LKTITPRVVAAAILAGGRATRFGGINKGSLEIGGIAIADRQLAALRAITPDVFVVGRADPLWSERGLSVIADAFPDAGPLGGIYTALVHSPADRTLIIGCDMPFLSTELLERLTAVRDADVVVARSPRGVEPLCGVYSRACASEIRARLDSGAFEASTLPTGFRVVEVDVDRAVVFVNVNTPHDYERAKGVVERQPEPNEDRITTGRRRPMTDAAS
jgi:molybdopterin-guanine dinucleotide biosynthesis protein A